MTKLRNRCFNKNSHKTVPEMELSTLFIIAFWSFWISLTILIVLVGHYLLINLILVFGSFNVEPERPQIETEPVRPYIQPIQKHEIEFEPVKVETIESRTGCDYWYGVIETLDATQQEKQWLADILYCESRCDPNAISHAGATGIAQWMPWVWNAYYPGEDINNPYLQIEKTLEKYREGRASMWCCNDLI